MKRKILLTIVTLCLGVLLCPTGATLSAQNYKGEKGKWTIVAKLKNPTDTLWLIPIENLREKDVVVRVDGQFRFTKELDKVKTFYILSPSAIRREANAVAIFVTAVPGEVMTVEGQFDEAQPTCGLTFGGTSFYKKYTEAYAAEQSIKKTQSPQSAIDFIRANSDNEVSATLIGSIGYNFPKQMEEALNLLDPSVRNGRMKEFIDGEIENVKEYQKEKEMQGKMLETGDEAPDFTLDDLSGKPLSLSSLRGKYLVLDFWGSWCGWCIKGFPKMKEYYQKYAGKFEILGMDCSDTKEKWQAAVKQHQLPWLHVYVPKGSTLLTDYLITGFPTKIILSPEGKVVTTVIGEDPKFYDILDELFK